MPKLAKSNNFVKNKKTKNSKSHAHLQIMMKHSAKFQVNSMKDVAGVVGTRYKSTRAITLSKMAETKLETTSTSSLDKKAIYKISNQSDERRKRSNGDKIGRTEGRNDGRMHTRTDEGHFYSPLHLRQVTNILAEKRNCACTKNKFSIILKSIYA